MTNEEAKVFLDNLKICIDEHPIVADWLVEIADHKTEPQTNADQSTQCVESVETMSCQECKHWIFDDRWGWFCPLKSQDECRYEPKTEPQTDGYISGEDFMKIFDEPQTDCPWK